MIALKLYELIYLKKIVMKSSLSLVSILKETFHNIRHSQELSEYVLQVKKHFKTVGGDGFY